MPGSDSKAVEPLAWDVRFLISSKKMNYGSDPNTRDQL